MKKSLPQEYFLLNLSPIFNREHNPVCLRGLKKVSSKMKVLKFGGTSVGSVKSIQCLKRIVEKEAKRQPVVVVVSALGGITDKLLSTAQLALNGDIRYKDEARRNGNASSSDDRHNHHRPEKT